MRLVVFSDLHVHAWAEHSRTGDDGVPSRLRHCVSVLERIRGYCAGHDVRAVLFGGDLFHKRGVLYTQPYNLVVEELARWRDAGIQLIANVGNHDLADRAGRVHALQALDSAGLLSTVGSDGWQNFVISADVEDEPDVTVTAVAYCPEADELRRRANAAIVDRADTEFTIGLFHHGFKGARVGTSLEYVVKEDADPDAYAGAFTVLLSGHYHQHQEIGTQGNAWYVGSPLEFVRGETSPKGFLVVDTVAAEIERVDLDLPRFVRLTGAQIRDRDFDLREHVAGNFVDVVYSELPMPWDRVEATLTKLGAAGVRACPTRDDRPAKASRLKADPDAGDRALLDAYVDHVGVASGDRAEILRVGMELIGEATK